MERSFGCLSLGGGLNDQGRNRGLWEEGGAYCYHYSWKGAWEMGSGVVAASTSQVVK